MAPNPQSRRVSWKVIFLITLGVVVVVGLVLLRVDQGPTYEGRTVKSWLVAIAAAETDAEMRETIQKILDAISKRR